MRAYWCQGCIFRLMCSHRELTKDHVLTSAYVKIFRTVTRNAVNKSVWRKKDCFWLPLNKHAVNIWLSSLRIRAHLSWRTGKHLHVLHVLRTYPTCSYPGYQDTTTYAALPAWRHSYVQALCRRLQNFRSRPQSPSPIKNWIWRETTQSIIWPSDFVPMQSHQSPMLMFLFAS